MTEKSASPHLATRSALETTPTSSSDSSDSITASSTTTPSSSSSPSSTSSTSLSSPSSLSLSSSLPTTINESLTTTPTQIPSSFNEKIPITIALTIFFIILIATIGCIYVRHRRKKFQKSLASAIAAEAGLSQNDLPPSPSPPPPTPPPTPPTTPTQTRQTRLNSTRSTQRYKVSTLQIEPMTKRLTLNLSQKGKSIVVKDENDLEMSHVVNVISLNSEACDDDDDSQKKPKRKYFWK